MKLLAKLERERDGFDLRVRREVKPCTCRFVTVNVEVSRVSREAKEIIGLSRTRDQGSLQQVGLRAAPASQISDGAQARQANQLRRQVDRAGTRPRPRVGVRGAVLLRPDGDGVEAKPEHQTRRGEAQAEEAGWGGTGGLQQRPEPHFRGSVIVIAARVM